MAFVTTSTIYSPALSNVPSGVSTPSSATELVSVNITENPLFTVAGTESAATAAAGFDAIATDIDSQVQTYIGSTLGVDTLTNSVDYIAKITSLGLSSQEDIYLNDANRSFSVGVEVKIRIY